MEDARVATHRRRHVVQIAAYEREPETYGVRLIFQHESRLWIEVSIRLHTRAPLIVDSQRHTAGGIPS